MSPEKTVRISLIMKLSAFALGMLIVVMGAGFSVYQAAAERLQEALLSKGEALASSVAFNLRLGVILEDEADLSERVSGVLADEDVLYVVVENAEGKRLLEATSSGLGESAVGQVEHPDSPDTRFLTAGSGDRFVDIVRPISRGEGMGEGPVGTVHLGLTLRDVQEAQQWFRTRTLFVTLTLVFLAILAYALLLWFVVNPLTRMAAAADKISAGDLAQRVEAPSHDEIGLLADSFNAMLDSLQNMVEELSSAGNQLARSSSEILSAAEEQSASSRQQSVSVNETTATMEELAHTSRQIAENSDRVAKTAEETFHTAQAGSRAVEDTISGMMSIKSQTENNTNKIFALSDKIQKIGNVVKIINDIADQTKLIAFNAAIEAAGAGEAGRRFSIVAVEVRRLADTVVESIEEIKNTITEIQLATNELILSSEKGIKDVEDGVNVASRGGEALQKIIAMIKQTTESSKQISLSTQQQRTASEQVVISMKEVSKTANQTATSSKQTIDIASELNSLSKQLAHVVEKFRRHAPPGP